MDENSSVLSQDAIDALLTSQEPSDADDDAPAEDATPSAEPAPAPEPAPAAEPATDVEPVEGPAVEPVAATAPEPAPAVPAEPVVEAAPVALTEPVPVAAPVVAPAPVTVNAPPPPGVTPPPGVVHAEPPTAATAADSPLATSGVTEERAQLMAEEAAADAVASIQDDLGLISGKITTLEAAIAKIHALEAEIALLKSGKSVGAGNGGLDLEQLKPLVDRILDLEKRAKNSPLFNLYEKFTCATCGNHSSAQARTRCGKCGKEGWFGRKDAA